MTDSSWLIGLCWLYGRSEFPPPPWSIPLRATGNDSLKMQGATGQQQLSGVAIMVLLQKIHSVKP